MKCTVIPIMTFTFGLGIGIIYAQVLKRRFNKKYDEFTNKIRDEISESLKHIKDVKTILVNTVKNKDK